MRALTVACLLITMASPLAAEDFLVIFDLSGSMGGVKEIEPAKDALRQVMDRIETPGARWGLRVYGTGCCDPDTRLEIPLRKEGRRAIRDLLPSLAGVASSPMPDALAAARKGELRDSFAFRRTAIVVSDGLVDREEACREARLLRESGVKVTVIGLEFSGTPKGHETLRYVAEHPDCAAGHYVRAERPDLVGEMLEKLAQAFFGLPYRMIALALSLCGGYYTTRFYEFVLERQTHLRRARIPRICNALFFSLAGASAALFLGSGAPAGFNLTLSVAAVLGSSFYLLVILVKDSVP
jgi:hypothetical protein